MKNIKQNIETNIEKGVRRGFGETRGFSEASTIRRGVGCGRNAAAATATASAGRLCTHPARASPHGPPARVVPLCPAAWPHHRPQNPSTATARTRRCSSALPGREGPRSEGDLWRPAVDRPHRALGSPPVPGMGRIRRWRPARHRKGHCAGHCGAAASRGDCSVRRRLRLHCTALHCTDR